jgi:pectin methylesterase-like acyl-CoA thioesterase
MARLRSSRSPLGPALGACILAIGCGREQEFTPDPAVRYSIESLAAGRCLQPAGQSSETGSVIEIADCVASSAQQFWFAASGSALSVKNVASGLCLDADSGQVAALAPVVQRPCSNASSQRFALRMNGGAVVIAAEGKRLVFGLGGGSTENHAIIDLEEATGGEGQRFEIVTATGGGSGSSPFDAGARPAVDGGGGAIDAGQDADSLERDAGTIPRDAGNPGQDSGSLERDAGHPELDAGGLVRDAGTIERDAGSPGQDAGSPVPNALCPGATQVLTVAANGSGDFRTIQAAVDAIPSNNDRLVQISVKAGIYDERITISKPFVCLTGESAESTIISGTAGTNITTGGTVIVTGSDFSAANITFRNTAGDGAGQAVALMAKGARQQFIQCRFVSYQDTLYVHSGTQYFKDCYIQGNTDYIFGEATAVFENCTMNNVSEGTAVTAPRTPQNATFGFVFLGGSLTANPTTSTVRSNHVCLGRPWGPYAAAAFINVNMGAHIAVDGWTTMHENDLSSTRFLEYGSTGPGANPNNPTRSKRQMTAAQAAVHTVANVLSPWVPGYSK